MSVAGNPLDAWMGGRIGAGRPLCRSDIEAWQLRQLRRTLALAGARSAFYRSHLAPLAGRLPASLADLAGYPFTVAADLQDDPLRFVCVSQGEIERVVTLDSSGTTGHPKRVFFTADDQDITLGFFEHGLRQMVGAGERVLILLPGEAPGSVGELLARAIRRLDAEPIAAGLPRDPAMVAERIQGERVDLVIGIPVQVLAVARLRRASAEGAPSRVLLCSDNISPALCAELAALWRCEIFRDWGMTELGYCGGVDCAAHVGYHLQETDFLFEIVDPETGAPLPPGELGEVVFTTLTRRGMPLIRYRTGDLARLVTAPCPCGSVLRRLDMIATRKTGRIALAGGDLTMALLDDALFKVPGLADFSASLTPGRGGTLSIAATPGADLPAGHLPAFLAAVEAALAGIPALRGDPPVALVVTAATEPPPPSRQKRTIRLETA